jgi:hypothetical protein
MLNTPHHTEGEPMPTRMRTKLTEDDVRDIRARYRPGQVSYQTLADEYHVTRGSIADIITGRTWRNVDATPQTGA